MNSDKDEVISERVLNQNSDGTRTVLRYHKFREFEYLDIRKFYLDFDEETWLPTSDGISIPATITNLVTLLQGILDGLSVREFISELRLAENSVNERTNKRSST